MTLARSLKVHLRVFDIHRTTLRIVTLRPQTTARFSTNYFHDTWHILAAADGAFVLGRLLWGLAFQRHPGTLVLIDRTHLVPTPFEADAPDPILLAPDGLTRLDDDVLHALKLRLRRCPGSPTTIRWHTFGMPAALARDDHEDREVWRGLWRDDEHRVLRTRERMSRRAGFITYTAPPAILRSHGLGIYQMHETNAPGYHPLAERDRRNRYNVDGEFQLIPELAADVSAAIVARREVLGDQTRPITDDAERREIYVRKTAALRRLRTARGWSEKER